MDSNKKDYVEEGQMKHAKTMKEEEFAGLLSPKAAGEAGYDRETASSFQSTQVVPEQEDGGDV